MVTINFTLFVELALFLLFLWGTGAFILKPVLKVLDDRDESVEGDLLREQEDGGAAQTLEGRYAEETAAMRRAADVEFRQERRKALAEHANRMAEARHKADAAVSGTRDEAMKQVEAQREDYKALAPELADLISERLHIGEDSS